MASKKRSRRKVGRAKPTAGADARVPSVLSTAVRGFLNMTAVAATSGNVLIALFAAKRFL